MRCKFCVMDTTAQEITFNDKGVCNFCIRAVESICDNIIEKSNLFPMLEQIKKDGENREYDCLIGLSGGLDSSTTFDWAINNGLKVLAFTLDNDYNTDEANHNILALVDGRCELKKIKVDHDIYTKLQEAFFKAGVKNCEIPTDHILMAVTYMLAKENDIKWILSGGNSISESIMPPSWGYSAGDLTHIKDIYEKFNNEKLDGIPLCSIWMWNEYKHTHGIKMLYPLDYLDYNLADAKKMLINKYGWQDYGDKHEESLFTKWFQNTYLYKKWDIDKRKAHYSSLIVAGQMTRDEALKRLEKDPETCELPINEFSEKDIMAYPKHNHEEYATETWYADIAKMIKENEN